MEFPKSSGCLGVVPLAAGVFVCVLAFAAVGESGFEISATPVSRSFASASDRPAPPAESVFEELIQEQKKSGLTLATVSGDRIYFAVFSKYTLAVAGELPHGFGATITRDGSEVAASVLPPQESALASAGRLILGIMRADGTHLRYYPRIALPGPPCWSLDGRRLAVGADVSTNDSSSRKRGLWVLDLTSGATQDTGVLGSVTSQCWSPDGKRIVYSDGAKTWADKNISVRVVDLADHTSRVLAKGIQATWSPDGNWIAFYDQDSYYAIRPTGTDKRKLFTRKKSISPLLWSPDSRIVAFESPPRLFEKPWLVLDDTCWLRARRLEDDSETQVALTTCRESFQWVSSREFIPR
jgi:WD40-like Beta Propeller Repeat